MSDNDNSNARILRNNGPGSKILMKKRR